MAIQCCRHCVAPKRYPGCHDHCPEYQAEKIIHDAQKEEQFKQTALRCNLYEQRSESIQKMTRGRKSGFHYKTKRIKE